MNEITTAFETADVVAENLPPGIGKSFLARALQLAYAPVDIITSDNSLVRQYCRDYPLNAVIGRDHYATEDAYKAAQDVSRRQASIFNPLSYHYARERGLRTPRILVVDEAHLLVDMLTSLSVYTIPISQTGAPENAKTERDLIKWCYARYERLRATIAGENVPGAVYREFEKMSRLYHTIREGSQKQLFQVTKDVVFYNKRMTKCLMLRPLEVPATIIRAVTGADKVLCMSGTLSRYDANQLAGGRTLEYFQHGYLTPPERRPVYYSPVSRENRKNPQVLAAEIRKIYNANRVPTLVHVTYGQQQELAEFLDDLRPICNNSTNKAKTREQFLVRGGLWLASGCAEGLDLPYTACSQVIIPTLLYPNRQDAFVSKRVGLPDGQYWYALRTYQNTIQRLGRGLRAEDDACVSHILDPLFSNLHATMHKELAPLNIIWGSI